MNFYSTESALPPPFPVNLRRAAFEREQHCFPTIPTCSFSFLLFIVTGTYAVIPLHCECKAEVSHYGKIN